MQAGWLGLGGGGRLELVLDMASVATAEDLVEILWGSPSRVLAPKEEGRGEGMEWGG